LIARDTCHDADLRRSFEMQIPLWERHLDAMRVEFLPDSHEYIALHVRDAVLGIVDPDAKLEIDRIGAEPLYETNWPRRLDHSLRLDCRLLAELDGSAQIGSMRDPHRKLQSHLGAAVRPIDHWLRDQLLVWYQMFRSIAGGHGNIARAKRADPTIGVAYGNDVARLDRLVDQDGKSTDEV